MFGRGKKQQHASLIDAQVSGKSQGFNMDSFVGAVFWMTNPKQPKMVHFASGRVPPAPADNLMLTPLDSARAEIASEFLRTQDPAPGDIFFEGAFVGLKVNKGEYVNGAFGLSDGGPNPVAFGALFLPLVTEASLDGVVIDSISPMEAAAITSAFYDKLHSA